MAFAFVLDDDELGFATTAAFALFFETGGFAFFDVFISNDTGFFGQNRRDMRIPDHQLLAGFDLLAIGGSDDGTVGDFVFLNLAALGVHDDDFAVALQGDQLGGAFGILTGTALISRCWTVPPATDLMSFSIKRTGGNTTGVEGTHGELRAGFTDGLGGDDTDGQILLRRYCWWTYRCRSRGRRRRAALSQVSGSERGWIQV